MRYHYTAFLVMPLLLLSLHAHADPAHWNWNLWAGSNLQTGGTYASVGMNPSASDGYDAMDRVIVDGRSVYAGTYHSNDGGEQTWTGPLGFYRDDFRAPLTPFPSLTQTWTIYVWGDPALPTDATYMQLAWSYGGATPPSELQFTLTFTSKPAAVTGGPAVGTVWNLGAGNVMLPVFRTSNGLEGYVFDFTATVIPEPSSLLALGVALAGFVGRFVRRRRA